MANEKLYASKMLIGALYRGELARELGKLGYAIEKTHADGRFEIAGVPRKVIEAFSTRRAEIAAAMAGARPGGSAENQASGAARGADDPLAQTRGRQARAAHELGETGGGSGFRTRPPLAGVAAQRQAGKEIGRCWSRYPALPGESRGTEQAMQSGLTQTGRWLGRCPISPSARRCFRAGMLAATLAWQPGAVTIGEAERAVARLEQERYAARSNLPVAGDSLTTDRRLPRRRKPSPSWRADKAVTGPSCGAGWWKPRLTTYASPSGQREAVKLNPVGEGSGRGRTGLCAHR